MGELSFHRADRLLTLDNVGVNYGERVILRDIRLQIDNLKRSYGRLAGHCRNTSRR